LEDLTQSGENATCTSAGQDSASSSEEDIPRPCTSAATGNESDTDVESETSNDTSPGTGSNTDTATNIHSGGDDNDENAAATGEPHAQSSFDSSDDSDHAPLATIVKKKIKPTVGKFYIVQFEIAKKNEQYKHYVGKIIRIVGGTGTRSKKPECEMMFARRTQRTSLLFSWPDVVDKAFVETKQLMFELSLQKRDRRGRLLFPTYELEPFKATLL
jgi:hypothetical protein